jgi:hypothetical protein
MDMGNPVFLIDLVDNPAEAGGVTGNDPHELPPDGIFVVAGLDEGEPGQVMLLSALPKRFLAEFFIH